MQILFTPPRFYSHHEIFVFTHQFQMNSVRGLKLNDQIVLKGRVGKPGRVPDFLWLLGEYQAIVN
jgi:hypothetical protein